uniref:Pentraxin family member n=1 Tax=Xiphophorus couchianus TaxID=32473 RepID=A0A3B5MTB1_9TELE
AYLNMSPGLVSLKPEAPLCRVDFPSGFVPFLKRSHVAWKLQYHSSAWVFRETQIFTLHLTLNCKHSLLSFYLSGDGVLFQVPDLGYLQTHLCFTWDSSSGAAAVFMNGRKSQTKIYRKGHTIRPGGRVILGQDPDSFLGEFDAKQSFVGEISDVTMWDSVLSDHAIQSLFNGRRVEKGNVFDWETVELIPFGEVEVMNVDLI